MERRIVYPLLILFAVTTFYSGQEVVQEKLCERRYSFINERQVCSEIPQVITKGGYENLRTQLEAYIDGEKTKGTATEVAVYFRDLDQGPVMGVHERAAFAPASLLKLPLAILYFNIEEETSGSIEKMPHLQFSMPEDTRTPEEKLVHPTSFNFNQVFPPPTQIESDHLYSIEELLFHLLAYSDNRANEVLGQYAYQALGGNQTFIDTYRDLGLISGDSALDETITVRGYASIFRLLYHANYLSPEHSEKLLNWMSQSSFTEGLQAGVPAGIKIAHKFGEREISLNLVQLHDCGVVYFPGNPYLLCIMTKGKDLTQLAGIIAEISRQTYAEVDSRRISKD